MKFENFAKFQTGVLIPVFSLRSKNSIGCGEFLDLKLLADWCLKSNLSVIQLLPINDTGDDTSPYSALSAFALHPIFCNIDAVLAKTPIAAESQKKVRTKITKLKNAQEVSKRLNYSAVLAGKLEILAEIFALIEGTLAENSELTKFIEKNPWVKTYSVFKTLKVLHNQEGWQSWKPEYHHGSSEVINRVWKDQTLGKQCLFFTWVQFNLENQFLESSKYLSDNKIMLKGDIPIMMNEDSADVWAHGNNFVLDQRAGAPPDMFSKLGQNWGFPIYNWEYLEAHDYEWWRQRLRQADKFYQAYRIDHVLGFFRIWTISKHNREGLLGFFRPSIFISDNDLRSIGFDNGRIKWLAEPHISGWKIQQLFGMRSFEIIARCFLKLGNEDLYVFKPEILGERSICELPLINGECETLLGMYRDRALIYVDEGLWSPSWTYRDCSRYQSISDHEKHAFEELVARRNKESEDLWQKNGERILRFMKETVPMLTCAEDLGVIPDCVPITLKNLGILSLKIPRWAREWNQNGQPYIQLKDYPLLSVCAPSVHDTSTIRDWWEHEGERWNFWQAMQFPGSCPDYFTPEVAMQVIEKILTCNSMLCMFQIQDLFATQREYFVDDSKAERINIPGTVQESNWSYRIPMVLEDLLANKDFSDKLSTLIAPRLQRSI